ncbi:MAG: DUF1707 domain-containing protein [Gemmatimonadaceae bacterium]|nr:DUF1707 domain-containing protein [Gemmatimonadaceae bacterium]
MSLELERERAVQALCAHFAQDHLTTQELEMRFEEVYRASSLEELRRLMTGLPVLVPTTVTTPLPTFAIAASAGPPREKRYLALMGEVSRQGLWSVPGYLKVSAIMGTVRLDLREAEVPATGVDIDATAVMGEVRILLPPGLHADVDGFAFMGEFSDRTAGTASTLAAPSIRVRGSAVMGSVRVETRLPRESALKAWKRRLLGD